MVQLGGLSVNNKPRPVVKDKPGGGIGGTIGRALGFDITPGFNVNSRPGGGVPFVSRTGGTGQVPGSSQGATPREPQHTTTGGNTTTYGGGSGSGSSDYDPGDLAYLDSQRSYLERQMGRTDTGLRQALEEILNSYNKEVSSTNRQRGRALEDFDDKSEISEQGRSRELGKIDTSSRMLADSLRQRLGLASGSGSSAYQIAAPRAVQRQASEQRGDVLEDYSANFQALDKDRTRATEDFSSLLEDLAAQRRSREGGVRSDILTQRNEIRDNLRTVAGEREKLLGGDYDRVRQAMSPYEAEIRGGESAIDRIFDKYTTKYNVKPVNVRNTQLRDYATDEAALRDNAATGNQSEYAPYKNYVDEDEEELY